METDHNEWIIGGTNINTRVKVNYEYLDVMAEKGLKYCINILTRMPNYGVYTIFSLRKNSK